jgi:hypothetical protein
MINTAESLSEINAGYEQVIFCRKGNSIWHSNGCLTFYGVYLKSGCLMESRRTVILVEALAENCLNFLVPHVKKSVTPDGSRIIDFWRKYLPIELFSDRGLMYNRHEKS